MMKHLASLFFLFVIFSSCIKGNTDIKNTQTVPSNLVVSAIPSTNGSGFVSFVASANNAVTFIYQFGNGVIETVPSGIINYQYTQIGNLDYTVIITAKNASGLSVSKTILVTINVSGGGTPVLIFSDEFNLNGAPDVTKWGYDIGIGSGGWGNNELQYYTSRPENVIVQNGLLKITAIKENYNGSAYTSSRLLSKGKFSFKYGRIEVRAKIPTGVGTWPAIWMLGDNINNVGWPACGETDIMEHRGNEINKIFCTLHYTGRSGANGVGTNFNISDATTTFHNYILEWSPSSMKFYVDTQLYYTFANNALLPYNQNFFILLNMAMGGNFGGTVDPAFTTAILEIDYIKVYQ